MKNVQILNGGAIKSEDTSPNLRVKLLDSGDPFNLTGYDVSLRIARTDSDTASVDSSTTDSPQNLTIENSTRGIVSYDWQSGDTDNSGTYLFEFVADDGSQTLTFPNNQYARLYIEDRI